MIIFTTMDYFLGFIFGYFCKYFISTLNKLSNSEVIYLRHEDDFLTPLREDDLP